MQVSQKPIDDKLTLAEIMAGCQQATSQLPETMLTRIKSQYGVTMQQWVKSSTFGDAIWNNDVPDLQYLLVATKLLWVKKGLANSGGWQQKTGFQSSWNDHKS